MADSPGSPRVVGPDKVFVVWPATAWDDGDWENASARGWTVTRVVTARRDRKLADARAARRRLRERENTLGLMLPASITRAAADDAAARWGGGPNLLAFLFAHPDSEAITSLGRRGEYFDYRSGDVWDLFFPGYYRSTENEGAERAYGASPVGRGYVADWYFHARDFDIFRREIEDFSEGRWRYSGGTDLVLVSGWMPARGTPTVDWRTTVSGAVTDDTTGAMTLSLPEVVERISQDLELALNSPDYGVSEVASPARPDATGGMGVTRDIVTQALGGILAALGVRALGG
jgi:hypothetical protein